MALTESEQYYSNMVAGFSTEKMKKTPKKQSRNTVMKIRMTQHKDKIKILILKEHDLNLIASKFDFNIRSLRNFCIDNWGSDYRENLKKDL